MFGKVDGGEGNYKKADSREQKAGTARGGRRQEAGTAHQP
jgi:hypothetical protein